MDNSKYFTSYSFINFRQCLQKSSYYRVEGFVAKKLRDPCLQPEKFCKKNIFKTELLIKKIIQFNT